MSEVKGLRVMYCDAEDMRPEVRDPGGYFWRIVIDIYEMTIPIPYATERDAMIGMQSLGLIADWLSDESIGRLNWSDVAKAATENLLW